MSGPLIRELKLPGLAERIPVRHGRGEDCPIFHFAATNAIEGRGLQRLPDKLRGDPGRAARRRGAQRHRAACNH